MDSILSIQSLNITMANNQILDNVSLKINQGEIVGLVGPSGVGKSTLLFAVSGLLDTRYTVSGQIYIANSKNILTLNHRQKQEKIATNISLVFQSAKNSLDPYETIGRQLKEIVSFKENIFNTILNQRIDNLLKCVGLAKDKDIIDKYPHQISGGMAQKICLAMALVGSPKILLADEPTSNMDAIYQLEFVKSLQKIAKKQNLAVLFVSHDIALISNFCERILVISKGRLIEDAHINDLLTQPQSVTAKELLAASRKMSL